MDLQKELLHQIFHLVGMFKPAMIFHYLLVMIQQHLLSVGKLLINILGTQTAKRNMVLSHNTIGYSSTSVDKTQKLTLMVHPISSSPTVNLIHGTLVVSLPMSLTTTLLSLLKMVLIITILEVKMQEIQQVSNPLEPLRLESSKDGLKTSKARISSSTTAEIIIFI